MSGANPQQALGQLSAAAQKTLGLPPEIKFASAFPFAGMNQQASRTAMDDKEFYWVENFLLLGPAKYRTLWDIGPALYTAPAGKTIVWTSWFNIGAIQYAAVFLSDGTAVQVAQSNGAVTQISSVTGGFYSGGQLPFAQQAGNQFLLICSNINQNAYWIWDGTLLYSVGSIGPYQSAQLLDGGSGYSSVPSVTIYGGSGGGVSITPVINEGSVVSLTVNNAGAGYLPGEIAQVAFSGGGTDDSAILTASLATGGGIASLTLVNNGSGYTNGTNYALGITGGGGSGATGTFNVVNGSVTGLTLTNGGSGFTASPGISFAAAGAGTNALAVAAIASAVVTTINVVYGGTGYFGTPTLTITGGGGSGATAVCTVSGGAINGATVTDGGSGYTSAPAVEIESGVNNAAAATLTLMPFGVSGTSIETFLSRVWISNPDQIGTQPAGGLFSVSAPESLTDFATSDGGLLFTNSDRFLREAYVALRQSNGYLYTLGDSSASVINNVQTSGTPTTTTFNYQNTSSQIGAAWRDSCQDYKQGVLFANPNGVQGLYGGSVKTLSDKMQDVFDSAFPRDPTTGIASILPGGLTPSSAVANIHTVPVYLLLMTIIDPTTNTQRNAMVSWSEKEWFITSQTANLTFICTQEVASSMTAWGTDGSSLFPLFLTPSTTLNKKISTKLYGGEREIVVSNPMTVQIRTTDMTAGQTGIVGTITMEAAQLALQNGEAPFTTIPPVSWPNVNQPAFTCVNSPNAVWAASASSMAGMGIGLTLTTTSPDFLLQGLSISYRQQALNWG